jgi:purine nucleoside phosphorylase
VRVCNMANLKVGIIGGTGLDDPDILSERAEKHVNTPFGKGRSREHHVFCCQGMEDCTASRLLKSTTEPTCTL